MATIHLPARRVPRAPAPAPHRGASPAAGRAHQHRLTAAGVLVLVGIAVGALTCGRPAPAQALAAHPVATWPGGQVPVCFKSRATSIEVAWVKDALRHSWSAVAPITFLFWETCPYPGQSFYVEVSWSEVSGLNGVFGRVPDPGRGSPTLATLGYCASGDCLTRAADYEDLFKATAVHEFGHVLGFAHEHQRLNSTPTCLPDRNHGDREFIANLIYLTSYYDPRSIMDYCRGSDGSKPLGSRVAPRISSGDAYGAQQAYGRQFPYWLSPSVTGILQ